MGNAGSEESMGRLMLGIGVVAVLRMTATTMMIVAVVVNHDGTGELN